MTMRCVFPFVLSGALLVASSLAQDAIGVTFTGQVLRLNTTTGAVSTLATGIAGKNSLAFDVDNRLWTTVRPIATASVWRLARINPFTGAETLPFPTVNVGDVRAMCIARQLGGVYAVREATPTDQLIHINTDTGVVTVIGSTNHAAIQGLEDPFGGGRAWDSAAGLLNIDLGTGQTNVQSLATIPAGLQFLCRHDETNARYVGRGSLYMLTTSPNVATHVVDFAGNPDLRGMEFTLSRRENFGQACPLPGAPFLTVQLPFSAGGSMQTVTTTTGSASVGALIVGFSNETYAGVPLPLPLDPLLGTSGCHLHVSADVLVAGTVNAGQLQIGIGIPPSAAFQQFFVQSLLLTSAPGGLSFSQGVRVRSRL